MRKILIIGSGKSSSYLIKYLLSKSDTENLFIIIADKYIAKTKALLNNHSNSKACRQIKMFNTCFKFWPLYSYLSQNKSSN